MLRNRFYYCQYEVTINANVIYRFEVRVLKVFLLRELFNLRFLMTLNIISCVIRILAERSLVQLTDMTKTTRISFRSYLSSYHQTYFFCFCSPTDAGFSHYILRETLIWCNAAQKCSNMSVKPPKNLLASVFLFNKSATISFFYKGIQKNAKIRPKHWLNSGAVNKQHK